MTTRMIPLIEQIQKLKSGYSMARFGDGELVLFNKGNINSGTVQSYDPTLVARMREVISTPVDKLLVGLVAARAKEYEFFLNIASNPQVQIGDANLFKYIQDNKALDNASGETILNGQVVEAIKDIWHKRSIVLLNFNPALLTHELFDSAKEIFFVETSRQNCFGEYDRIIDQCSKFFGCGFLFLASCGPAAKVLAYDFCKQGEQCIDIGQAARAYNALYRQRYSHLMSLPGLREKESDDYFSDE